MVQGKFAPLYLIKLSYLLSVNTGIPSGTTFIQAGNVCNESLWTPTNVESVLSKAFPVFALPCLYIERPFLFAEDVQEHEITKDGILVDQDFLVVDGYMPESLNKKLSVNTPRHFKMKEWLESVFMKSIEVS